MQAPTVQGSPVKTALWLLQQKAAIYAQRGSPAIRSVARFFSTSSALAVGAAGIMQTMAIDVGISSPEPRKANGEETGNWARPPTVKQPGTADRRNGPGRNESP